MKKVAFYSPSLTFGGREKVLSQLMNFFCEKSEVEVFLILYGKTRDVYFHIDDKVKIIRPNFEYHEYPNFVSLIKTLYFVRKTAVQNKIDIIISFEEIWNRFVLISTIGLNKTKVISNRNNPHRKYGFIDSFLAKVLYPQADVLIAQTKIAKEIYEKRYKLKHCVVIGNPIQKIENHDIVKRENIIVSVGRLMNSKNHDRLIRIFAQTRNDGWKMVIVGGDFANHNNMNKLSKLINELNLNDKVILTGSKKDVNSYLLQSKIFAFTSSKEGFPNVIGEAMASGLPVISYDCVAGPSEMIDDNINGFLIPLYDDQLFVEKIQFLMENEKEREEMGQKALEKIAIFDSKIICEKFYDLIISK